MIKGDILLIYNTSIPDTYFVYDRHLAIKFSFTGISLCNIDKLIADKDYKVITPKTPMTWNKRLKLNNYMIGLITQSIKPTFKERLNALKYIIWIYSKVLNIELIERPIPISQKALLLSDKVIIHQ